MTKHIGRKITIGLGKESARGTRIASDFWFPANDAGHRGMVTYAENNASIGTIANAKGAEIISEWGEGGYSAPIGSSHFGLVLLNLFGAVASATAGGESIVYDHTYTLGEDAQHDSLTLEIDQPNGDKSYALGMVKSLSIAFEKSKILDYTVDMITLKGVTQTLSPSIATENIFRPQDFTFKLAADAASLGAAGAITVKSMTLDVAKNIEPDEVLGDTDPADFLNKEIEITGEVTLMYDNQTYENYALANTQKAMQIQLLNADVTIGSAENPTLLLNLENVYFQEVDFERGLGDLVYQKLSFKALYKQSASKILNTCVLTNLTASY